MNIKCTILMATIIATGVYSSTVAHLPAKAWAEASGPAASSVHPTQTRGAAPTCTCNPGHRGDDHPVTARHATSPRCRRRTRPRRRQASVATEQRDFALRELSRAASVNEFNQFLLSDAAPSGRPFTAGELLARAEAIVQHQHAGADVNRTDMLVSIGRQYRMTDHENDALRVITQATTSQGRRPIRRRMPAPLAPWLPPWVVAAALIARRRCFAKGWRCFRMSRNTRSIGSSAWSEGSLVARETYHMDESLPPRPAGASAHATAPIPVRRAGAQYAHGPGRDVSCGRPVRAGDRAFEQAYARTMELGRENTESAGTLYNNWALTLPLTGQPLQAEGLFRRAMPSAAPTAPKRTCRRWSSPTWRPR